MPYDYNLSEEEQRRALWGAVGNAGARLSAGRGENPWSAVGGALAAGLGSYQDSKDQIAGKRAEEEEADQEELEELRRRTEAVNAMPPEIRNKMSGFIAAPNFWELAAKEGFREPEKPNLPTGYRMGEGGSAERIPGLPGPESKPPSLVGPNKDRMWDEESRSFVPAPGIPAPGPKEPKSRSGRWEAKGGRLAFLPSDGSPPEFHDLEDMDDGSEEDRMTAVEGFANTAFDNALDAWKEETKGMERSQWPPMPNYQSFWDEYDAKLSDDGEEAPPSTQVPLGAGGRASGPIKIPAERPGRPGEVPGSPRPRPIDAPAEPPPLPMPPGLTPEMFIQAGTQGGDTPQGIVAAAGQYGPEFAAAVQAALGGG